MKLFASSKKIDDLDARSEDNSAVDNLWSEFSSLTDIVANLCLEFTIPGATKQTKFVIQVTAFHIALLDLPVLLNGRLGPPRNLQMLGLAVVRGKTILFEALLSAVVPLVSVPWEYWLISPSDAELVVDRSWNDGDWPNE